MAPSDSATAIPLLDTIVGDTRVPLFLLLGAVIFVLLIAAANAANLQLSRSIARTREVAIRTALGAGRLRIIRQILTENILLSVVGGAMGLFLGYAGMRVLLASAPSGMALIDPDRIPRIGEHGSAVVLDWRVLAFTFLCALLAEILADFCQSVTSRGPTSTPHSRRPGHRGFREPVTTRLARSLW